MGRLTERKMDYCQLMDCGITCTQKELCDDASIYNKLRDYENAEEQGLLVILPVKSGDTIYQLRDKKHALGVGVHPRHISRVCVYGTDWIAEHQGNKPCAKKELGKTWFLTREEAEAALSDMREDNNED